MVRSSKSKLIYAPFGGQQNVDIFYDSAGSYNIPPEIRYSGSESGWIGVQMIPTGEKSGEFIFTLTQNSRESIRSATATFEDDLSGSSVTVSIIQVGIVRPIWGDYKYISGAEVGVNYQYRIKVGDDIIFQGVSVPCENNIPEAINLTRILESYINTRDLINIGNNVWTNLGMLGVDFYKLSGDTEEYKSSFAFFNDWSGTRDKFTNEDIILNDPINHRGCNLMMFPFCLYNATGSTWVLENKTSTQTYTSNFPEVDNAFIICNKSFTSTNTQTLTYKSGTKSVSYDLTYCGQGALYYRNRYGGWDGFLLEGNIIKSETYTKQQYTKDGLNTSSSSWYKVTDKNSIVTKYETTTSWLTDEESDRLVYHLLSSPTVYFQSFSGDGNLISVNITNTTTQYKHFRNGRKLVQYTITFEESQTKQVHQ